MGTPRLLWYIFVWFVTPSVAASAKASSVSESFLALKRSSAQVITRHREGEHNDLVEDGDGESGQHAGSYGRCDYASNVTVVWWPISSLGSHAHHEYSNQDCDVRCVEPASSEDCFQRADGVAYHLPDMQSAQVRGPLPTRPKGQVSIAFSMESTANYPWQELTTLQAQGYNAAATTNPESDVPISYFGRSDFESLLQASSTDQIIDWKNRRPVAAFISSHCNSRRDAIVSRLAKLGVPIHSLGACAPEHTENHYGDAHSWSKDSRVLIAEVGKRKILQKYRVYLAFENSLEPGYITEKIMDAYAAGAVPAYHGASDVTQHVPRDSAVILPAVWSVNDASLNSVASKIKAVLFDQHTFDDLMAWRFKPIGSLLETPSPGHQDKTGCRICRLVYAEKHKNKVRFDRNTQRLVPIVG